MFRQLKVRRMVLLGLISFFIFCSTMPATGASSEDLSKVIPSRSLFCIRVNNLNQTLTQIDQFLAGASPIGVSVLAKSELMSLLSSPQLAGLNMDGNFAVFTTEFSGQTSENNATPDIFMGILVPVTDYKQFIGGIQGIAQPDDKGIARLVQNEKEVALITQSGKYAMFAAPDNYDQLIAIRAEISSINSSSIGSVLNAEQLMQSASEPIWIYGNMQQVAKTYSAAISSGITQIKEAMVTNGTAEANMPVPNVQAMATMYADIMDKFVNQTQAVSLSINPKTEVLNITSTIRSLPKTDMATLFTSSGATARQNDKLLPYLDNGAAANYELNLNSPFWKQVQLGSIDLMTEMSEGTFDSAFITKMKALTDQAMQIIDGPVAYSITVQPNSKPAFMIKYAAVIKDESKFNKLIQDGLALVNSKAIADYYKSMGMEMSFSLNKETETYKNVTINSGKFVMKPTDTSTSQMQMMQAMYGDGFDFKWVVNKGLFLSATGGDSDSAIHELIDRSQATSRTVGTEINKALLLLPAANQADFFVTINPLRMFSMITAMIPILQLPQTNFQTTSNIAAIGKAANGQLVINVAVPKEQIQEIMTAVLSMQQQVMQQSTTPAPGSVSPQPFTTP